MMISFDNFPSFLFYYKKQKQKKLMLKINPQRKKIHRRVQSLPSLDKNTENMSLVNSHFKIAGLHPKIAHKFDKFDSLSSYLSRLHSQKLEQLKLNETQHLNILSETQNIKKKVTHRNQIKHKLCKKNLSDEEQAQEKIELYVNTCSKKFTAEIMSNFCYQSNFPYQRIGSCMLHLEGSLFLIGGTIRRKFFYVNETEKFREVLIHRYRVGEKGKWKQILTKQPNIQLKNVYGHSIERIGNSSIAIIGGVLGDTIKTLYLFNSTIKIIDTQNQSISEIFWNIKLRDHASCSTPSCLYIHGGLDPTRSIRKQLTIIYFPGQKSSPQTLIIQTNEALSYHKMLILQLKNKLSVFRKKKFQGLYIFGGQNRAGLSDNKLKFYQIQSISQFLQQPRRQIAFQALEIAGTPPQPRIHHSMNLLAEKFWMLIVGGQNSLGKLLHDIWVVDLHLMEWCQAETSPSIQSIFGGISKHATASTQNQLFIFGGRHSIDVGHKNLWNLKILKQKETADENKQKQISSFWSISCSRLLIDDEPI